MHKRLPARLVERMRHVAHFLFTDRRFAKWNVIDHRKGTHDNPNAIDVPGGRVREMKVRYGPKKSRVVVKRTHFRGPQETLDYLERKVLEFNMFHEDGDALLLPPRAYVMNKMYAIMGHSNRPNVLEIIGTRSTLRGRKYLKKLAKRNQFTIDDIRRAAERVEFETQIKLRNLAFLGIRNKKFVFVPLLDYD